MKPLPIGPTNSGYRTISGPGFVDYSSSDMRPLSARPRLASRSAMKAEGMDAECFRYSIVAIVAVRLVAGQQRCSPLTRGEYDHETLRTSKPLRIYARRATCCDCHYWYSCCFTLAGDSSGSQGGPRSQCSSNLKQLGLAFHNFEGIYKRLPTSLRPPSNVAGSAEQSRVSVLTDLLPYLEQDAIYSQYNKGINWNQGNNRVLGTTVCLRSFAHRVRMASSRHRSSRKRRPIHTESAASTDYSPIYGIAPGVFTQTLGLASAPELYSGSDRNLCWSVSSLHLRARILPEERDSKPGHGLQTNAGYKFSNVTDGLSNTGDRRISRPPVRLCKWTETGRWKRSNRSRSSVDQHKSIEFRWLDSAG